MKQFSIQAWEKRIATLTLAITCATLVACDLSDVGDQGATAPVAEAAVVGHDNAGTTTARTATVRSGAEVVLFGGNSFGIDGPILDFEWEATNAAAQLVQLIQRSLVAQSFTAPFVDAPTTLTFRLTVRDAELDEATADVEIMVLPADDPNRFLIFLGDAGTVSVVAATTDAINQDTIFDVSVRLRVTYFDVLGNQQIFESPREMRMGTWFSADGTQPADTDFYGNPRFTYEIPGIDLDDINAAFVNLGPDDPDRQKILELDRIENAVFEVVVTLLDSGTNPDLGVILLDDANGDPINVVSAYDGTEIVAILPLTDLSSQQTATPHEDAATATVYYDTIDPNAERTTLSDWLTENCMDFALPDFGADIRTIYTNNFDLGFGREMYVKRGADCTTGELGSGDLASVVLNYSTLLGAAKGLDPIIAVAMEYTGTAAAPGQRFAKFYVYAPDEGTGDMVRIGSANFDGRGEKFVPGVCAACHGGQPEPVVGPVYANDGDVGSIFMPWDLDSFLFTGPDDDAQKDPSLPPSDSLALTDVDRALLTAFTRAEQEDEFRAMNEAVLATWPSDAPARRLVHGFYGDREAPGGDFDGDTLSGDFVSGFVPAEWDVPAADPQNPVTPRQLYLDVIAQTCRACHTQLSPDDQVLPTLGAYDDGTTDDFVTSVMSTDAFLTLSEGTMPLARLTSDRFWAREVGSSTAADQLAAHLGLAATTPPGAPIAEIVVNNQLCDVPIAHSNVDGGVSISGAGSRFAESSAWTLTPQGGAPVKTLIGANDLEPTFLGDQVGEYELTLTVTNRFGVTDTAMCTVDVQDLTPTSFAGTVAPVVASGFGQTCGGGACHSGSAQGWSYAAVTGLSLSAAPGQQLLNLAVPEDSLFLTYSTGATPGHAGGNVFTLGGPSFNAVLEWIRDGALDN